MAKKQTKQESAPAAQPEPQAPPAPQNRAVLSKDQVLVRVARQPLMTSLGVKAAEDEPFALPAKEVARYGPLVVPAEEEAPEE